MLEENQRLQKQVTKQDSLIVSLQEGNRVMQEQINLLNRELREAKKEFDQKLQAAREMGDRRVADRQQRAARISELERANRKLTGQTQW